MPERIVRKPGSNECLYMDLQDSLVPVTIRCVAEISANLDTGRLNAALSRLLETHYGYNLCYKKGNYYRSEYVPEFKITEIPYEDMLRQKAKVDFRDHTLEVYAYRTENDRCFLIFDFFHGATDGHGAIRFVYDFFSVLRGQEPSKPDFSTTDYDIVKNNGHTNRKLPIGLKSEPLNVCLPHSAEKDHVPVRFTVKGGGMAAVARAAVIIASFFKPGKSVIMVPTDVRSYSGSGKFLCGNISLPLFLQLEGNEDPKALFMELIERIKNGEALNENSSRMYNYNSVPGFIRRPLFNLAVKLAGRSGKFVFAALISNIGRIDDKRFENPYFDVTDFYMRAGCSPLAAYTVVTSVYRGMFSLGLGWNESKISEEQALIVADRLKSEFTPKKSGGY